MDPKKSSSSDPERDALWELMGKASRPASSLRFTQDVLRAVRQEKEIKPSWKAWFAKIFTQCAPSFAAATAVLAIGGLAWLGQYSPSVPGSDDKILQQISALDKTDSPIVASQEDFDLVSNLDTLLASEEHQAWIADSSSY